MRLISRKSMRIVNKMVRVAGGEDAFIELVDSLHAELNRAPTAGEVVYRALINRVRTQETG